MHPAQLFTSPFFALYTCLNLLSFTIFAYDKVSAKVRTGRIPEKVLLLVSLAGPFGAAAAMIVFRHKTRHITFLLVPFFAAMHLLIFLFCFSTSR